MPYIGKLPVNGFHTKQVISGDGSETTFTLRFSRSPRKQQLIVSDNACYFRANGSEAYDLAIWWYKNHIY